ncbi:hypothetical protein BD626DRAFT_569145 [Schizophyllum amplum]|uniref:S-adenosyl-L-methionine dependent methyltransferase n=1 Tax=Schizophyllum amplum TaxID=97359 RepID=A0A550CE54_9AGAR|nr:hypothetical protein BD626DRAFT_569145 [Auriculariopsis ampla]
MTFPRWCQTVCKRSPHARFSDANAQIYLTQALLHRDFGVRIELTSDRLCPPVPNRLNYILWLQDIVAASRNDNPSLSYIPALGDTPALASDTTNTSAHLAQNQPILGIDIGTGASAIYPLLGCATDARWAFVATELDPLSIRLARENISRNGLDKPFNSLPKLDNDMHSHVEDSHPRVEIIQASGSGPLLLPLATHPNRHFAFTMCNPPFYASAAEIAASAAGKARPAAGARRVGVRQASRVSSSRTTPEPTGKVGIDVDVEMDAPTALAGAPVEMVTPGGESAFVARMIAESVQYSERCGWYTSMLGKLASVAEVVRVLKQYESLARVSSQALSSVLPLRNEMTQPLLGWSAFETNFDEQMEATIRRVCAALPGVAIQANAQSASLTIFAASNTWSRAARRKAQRGDSEVNGGGSAAPALVVRVWWTSSEEESPSTHADSMDCEDSSSIIEDAAAEYGVQAHVVQSMPWTLMGLRAERECIQAPLHEHRPPALHIRWLLGRDRALFETFWSHLARKVDGSA